VTPEYAASAYPTTANGFPQHFTIVGSTLTVYPSSSGTVTISYYRKIPALANGGNWLLTAAPEIYLFGALVEASDFMRDPEELQKYAARFQAAVKALMAADVSARYSRAVARVSGPTP
jgi:hypothetical protein